MTHDDVRNELAAAKRKVRAMVKAYERAADGSADNHGCAHLRAKLARAIVDEATHKARGLTPEEMLEQCRRLIVDDVRGLAERTLNAEHAELSPGDRAAAIDAAQALNNEGLEACARRLCALFEKWQDEQRLEIWRGARNAIDNIERVCVAFETAPDEALTTVH